MLGVSNRDVVLISSVIELKTSHGAQFSVKDCSVGDGRRMEIPVCAMTLVTFKVRAALGFPHVQDIAIPIAFLSGQDPRLWVTKSLLLPPMTICTSGILFSPRHTSQI